MNEDMNRLTAEAAAVDAESAPAAIAPAAAPEPAAPPVDPLVEARGLIGFIVVSACAVLPCLKPVYTDKAIEDLARVTAPLLEQYGITLGGLMGKYGNWLNFAMVALPIGAQTHQALKAEAARREGQGAPDPQPAPAEQPAPQPAA